MTLDELTMSVGPHAAARLELLKSRLGDTAEEDREREGASCCCCAVTLEYHKHWAACPWAAEMPLAA